MKRSNVHCSVSFAAGPTGKVLLMPEDPNAVFIMVATGTGIAPYRSFWRRQFVEDIPNYKCAALDLSFMLCRNHTIAGVS